MQNSIWYNKLALIACFAFVLLFGIQGLRAQSYSYTGYDMEGDTIHYVFPPPDSTYAHNRIGIKFRTGFLDYSQLCYTCDTIVETKTRQKGARAQDGARSGVDMEYFSDCMGYLMNQKFGLDIILDPLIKSILESNGVTYLMRMTAANPCIDTLSLARTGDTIPIDDYNMMVAYFNNDTSVIPTLTQIYLARSLTNDTAVEIAEPDYFSFPAGGTNTPSDPFFAGTNPNGPQTSLTMIGMNGANGAWNYDVGEENITVAVVDQGIDYWRCDLGNAIIPNDKVIGGWDFYASPQNEEGIVNDPTSLHGTGVASIIAGLTNNYGCLDADKEQLNAMAGIAGGWVTGGTPPQSGNGVGLVGYDVLSPATGGNFSDINIASAIFDAANLSISGSYGKGADVINLSIGYFPHEIVLSGFKSMTKYPYSLLVRNAIAEAFYNASSLVAAKGDFGLEYPGLLSSTEPGSEIITVGASDQYKARNSGSNWGWNLDLIAPGDNGPGPESISLGIQNNIGDTPGGWVNAPDAPYYVENTSGATPHVSV